MGIPNIYPYKEQLMNAMERKESLDKDKREQMKAMQQGKTYIPCGNIANYAA